MTPEDKIMLGNLQRALALTLATWDIAASGFPKNAEEVVKKAEVFESYLKRADKPT